MKRLWLIVTLLFCTVPKGMAQVDGVYVGFGIPSQNTLMFNRFLINPTFSALRQETNALSLLHRNQSVSFDNNNQSYLLAYSGKTGENNGAGISIFSQREGVVSNFGLLTNYAYGVKLNEESSFTFGANLAYYKSGFDQTRAITGQFDPYLSNLQDGIYLRFQPGFNVQYNAFDFGMVAENLIDFDLKNGVSLSETNTKIFAGHVQHTYSLKTSNGITEGGRMRSLLRGRNTRNNTFELGGSLILDLPKLGWLQAGYDSYYGPSTGVGFNLSPHLSMGYTLERGLDGALGNLGITHEITVAYTFKSNPSPDRIMLEADYVEKQDDTSESSVIEQFNEENQILELKEKLAQNDAILGQLTARSDSLDSKRKLQLEKRFTEALETVRNKTGADSFIRKNNLEKPENIKHLPEITDEMGEKQKVRNDTLLSGIAQDEIVDLPKELMPKDSITHEVSPINDMKITETKRDKVIAQHQKYGNIKSSTIEGLKDVKDGFYLIANVYRGGVYLKNFMQQLETQGFKPQFITNPENNLKYVYLRRYETFGEAEAAAKSKLEGVYTGSLWILNVKSGNLKDRVISNSKAAPKSQENPNEELLRKNVVVRDKIVSDNTPQSEIKQQTEYYIIANVFASARNAARFIKYLNSLGLSANYFINPKNKYRYVYLKRHDTWNGALLSYYTGITKIYEEKTWIMRVTPELLS